MTDHFPIRPSWLCTGCGADWPCQTRRRQLAAEYDHAPVSLSLFMSTNYNAAIQDLPNWTSPEIHHRFFGWFRRS